MVEYASTRLMSHCLSAMVAANRAVSAPVPATTAPEIGARAKSTLQRATRYTPAVTIVAAWIRADTGVGPAIASGSQVKSGTCADLPVAPTKKSSAIAVNVPTATAGDAAACARKLETSTPLMSFVTKLIVWKLVKTRNVAIIKPKSPIRFMTNAFFAADPATSHLM